MSPAITIGFWGLVTVLVLWGLSYDLRHWLASRRVRRNLRKAIREIERAYELPSASRPPRRQPWGSSGRSRWS